jgi:UDPglucose 6-dehydrogenase
MNGLGSTPQATQERNICVVGAGHVGLVTAACFAAMGHRVVCLDVDEKRIQALKLGQMPFFEPNMAALVTEYSRTGRLRFATSYEESIPNTEFVFIAVPTPTTAAGSPDLRYVRQAARSVAAAAGDSRPILISKSTAPVGISETLERVLSDDNHRGNPLPLVANPEFLQEGTAVRDFLKPDRVVIGSSDDSARAAVGSLYEPLGAPILYTDIKSAEMVKYASNAFLATKISFINEIASVCEKVGADVRDVARGMGLDDRIGPQFLGAGIGFGGSCLPKDVKALSHLAAVYGSRPQLLQAVLEINNEQKRRTLTRLREVLGGLRGMRLAIFGLSFKPGTDDIRDAPSLDLIRLLEYEEADVRASDPVAIDQVRAIFPDLTYTTDPYEAAAGADAVIVVTDWPEYREIDFERLRSVMRTPVIADGRNLFDGDKARQNGFVYMGTGVPDGEPARPNGVAV